MSDASTQNRGFHAAGSVASIRPWLSDPTIPAPVDGTTRRPNTKPNRPSEPCVRKPYHRHGHRPPEHST